ncbi:conjugal transfer protein TraB [Candidatus Igneacidithiobacillus taiwanensis]|uniref:conjugal transfer protein TraB n=1 Tax=Candidatus Igneacidithiobacillus taiwanensis TaxID=1945924 RepID=UPI00289CC346|nr:conjugal transfer protein TraB [Candidatus Igneacidithiobacillus taiwanensis]
MTPQTVKKILRNCPALFAGALIGLIAWPHAIFLAPIVFLLLPLFRLWAAPFLVMLGYHLATTWGLIHGTAVFFPYVGLTLGIAFWVFSSLAFALPYLLYKPIRNRLPKHPALAALLATLITSGLSTILPPLGLIGWTSPWIGAINEGWLGLAWVLFAIPLLAYLSAKVDDAPVPPLVVLPAVLMALPFIGAFALPRLYPPSGWTAIDTHGGHLTAVSAIEESERLVPKVLSALRQNRVVLLPETIAGYFGPGTKAVWQPVIHYTKTHPDKTVLLGAAVPHGIELSDDLVEIHKGRFIYLPDRIPVPFSMWHPWRPEASFSMRVFGKPEVATVAGHRVGYLICYEQLLMWPALDLYPQRIRVLLAPANDWWAEGTDIPAIQRASARAWGRFLGVPVLFAVNS